MYYIPFSTFYCLVHRVWSDNKPFVFRTIEGRRFAIVDNRLYIGPRLTKYDHIFITSRDRDKDNPSICLGVIGSGPCVGGFMQQSTTLGVQGLSIEFGIAYPFRCNDCKFLTAEEGSGCYDVNDEEIPYYWCERQKYGDADNDIPLHETCRMFYPDEDVFLDYEGMKKVDFSKYESKNRICERLFVVCLMLQDKWIRCEEWKSS